MDKMWKGAHECGRRFCGWEVSKWHSHFMDIYNFTHQNHTDFKNAKQMTFSKCTHFLAAWRDNICFSSWCRNSWCSDQKEDKSTTKTQTAENVKCAFMQHQLNNTQCDRAAHNWCDVNVMWCERDVMHVLRLRHGTCNGAMCERKTKNGTHHQQRPTERTASSVAATDEHCESRMRFKV